MFNNLLVLRSLSRKYKLLILTFVDFFTAFAVWIIFGPPSSVLISSNFQISLYDIVLQNYLNFIIPTILTFFYFSFSGFYRSSIRYSESNDLIIRALKGSFIFGISWGIVYALESEIIRNQKLKTLFYVPQTTKKRHLKKLAMRYPNLEVYLAIPSLNLSERRSVISSLENLKVAIRTIPSLHDLVTNQKKMVEMQDLSIDDILPRRSVNKSPVSFNGHTLMITGAGGSIGSEIVRQVIDGEPKKVVLFELSEINLYSIQEEIESIKKVKNILTEFIYVLGDVKDKARLNEIISNHKVDFIYHAAAYKHVPIVEYHENISEGLKNNIFGTKALCEIAAKCSGYFYR